MGQPRAVTAITILGAKRSDPLPRRLRRMANLQDRKKLLYKILRKSAEPMRNMMQAGSPVKTGALQKSFQIRKAKKDPGITKLAVYVGGVNGSRVESGVSKRMVGWRSHWAELGTIHHPGAYFIQPAIRRGIPMAQAIIQAELNNLLKKLGPPLK